MLLPRIDQNVVYRSLAEDPANIYSLLLVAGYLKTPKKKLQDDGSYLCEVCIPNKEITSIYKKEIMSYFLQTGMSLPELQQTKLQKVFMQLIMRSYRMQ